MYFRTRVIETSNTSATRMRHERHKYNTYNTIAALVKNVDYGNGTSKNIFSHHSISYMANERLLGVEQFCWKNHLLEMPPSNAKMRLKIAPQKLNFVMTKAISKGYPLDYSCNCPYTFPHIM